MDQIALLPKEKIIHLFYAGPIPPLIKMGSRYNPRIEPPINIYYYGLNPITGKKEYSLAFNSIEVLKDFNII
jgi:hypothetical protein